VYITTSVLTGFFLAKFSIAA